VTSTCGSQGSGYSTDSVWSDWSDGDVDIGAHVYDRVLYACYTPPPSPPPSPSASEHATASPEEMVEAAELEALVGEAYPELVASEQEDIPPCVVAAESFIGQCAYGRSVVHWTADAMRHAILENMIPPLGPHLAYRSLSVADTSQVQSWLQWVMKQGPPLTPGRAVHAPDVALGCSAPAVRRLRAALRFALGALHEQTVPHAASPHADTLTGIVVVAYAIASSEIRCLYGAHGLDGV
jgi:hypothetical protein